jgi:MFS family permease
MAGCRLGGDPVVARFGPVRTVRAGCLLAAAGLVACVGAPAPTVAVIGFGLVGVGVANVVPTLFGAAGRLPGLPAGMALSAVAMPGYAGFLAGPPLLGFVAEVSGLRWAFVLVGLLCGLLVLLAPATGRRASPSPRPG